MEKLGARRRWLGMVPDGRLQFFNNDGNSMYLKAGGVFGAQATGSILTLNVAAADDLGGGGWRF